MYGGHPSSVGTNRQRHHKQGGDAREAVLPGLSRSSPFRLDADSPGVLVLPVTPSVWQRDAPDSATTPSGANSKTAYQLTEERPDDR